MRSVKSEGGLSRGTGFKLEQRNTYLFSRTACAEVAFSLQELTGKQFSSTKEISIHKYCGSSRISRDEDDANKLIKFFSDNNPFKLETTELANVVTGVIADTSVNILQCKGLGNHILKKMEHQVVADFVFRKRWTANNMAKKSTLVVTMKLSKSIQICYSKDSLQFY